MKKQILSIAIMLTLPLTAMAGYTYNYVDAPASVPDGGTATYGHYPPYQILTIENDDKQHIASTAYVKGAYNDTIAGMNSLSTTIKNRIYVEVNKRLVPVEEIVQQSFDKVTSADQLVNGMAVKDALNELDTKIDDKRVEVYTTWDNDNATQEVAFINATPAQSGQ